ncbi:MAG TPA: NAD-dependent epimerase/dehydratase family protein [Vicinamibacterales bacterium]|nr:NAD-dependent epimerase/dehydratase family protein [Vicinamibacterales bacterium]
MRVFLTGATGYIGSAVLDALHRAGHQVVAIARDREKVQRVSARGATAILAELGTPKRFLDAVQNCDAVIHAAFERSPRGVDKDRQAIDMLSSALTNGQGAVPRVFVYTSGVWVLGTKKSPAAEDAPLEPAAHVAWRPSHEAAVLDAGHNSLRTVVVRPGIVYGGSRGIVSDLLKDALNGLVRVIGNGKNCWPCVYDRDLADLYVRLLQTPEAAGVFHANDEADERVNEIVEAIATHLSQKPDVRHVPLAEAAKKLGTYAEALALDQRVRSPRARALGWTPSLRSVSGNVARLFEEFRNTRES